MSKEIINIKGTRFGLVFCLNTTIDFEILKSNLKSKVESGHGFFQGAKFTFSQEGPQLPLEKLALLNEICTDNGMIFNEDIPVSSPVSEQLTAAMADDYKVLAKSNVKEFRFPTKGIINDEEMTPTMFIKHGLRSGQKIHFQGNVTIQGDVNAGAEIVATGDIIIMGTLRGIAHAGALGDKGAKIVAYRLQPNQLRLANMIGRSPDQNYTKANFPEIAHISNGSIVIEEYMTTGMKNKKTLKKA